MSMQVGSDELEKLFRLYKSSGDLTVRNEIVSKNLYIAEILAKKMTGRGVEFDDLFQVASFALLKCVERFDVEKGLKFTTFATPSILGELKNYFRDKSRLIRMSRKSGLMFQAVKKSVDELTLTLQRAPLAEEVAKAMGLTIEEVLEVMEYSTQTISLDANTEDMETSLYEVIPDTKNPFENFEDREELLSALHQLKKEESQLIYERFYEGKSQSEVSIGMGVSQMYVSRLERKVLGKLKHILSTTD